MNLSKVRIEIGLPAPLRLLHVSDTHLALADGRDGERKQALAARRSAAFGKEGDGQSETFLLNVKKILRGRTGF